MNVSSIEKEDGINPPKQLDAGALFVLKSKGSWVHCGYHLTTSIVAPALLSLPFALALLGWVPGVLFLTLGAMVTFYSCILLSMVLEHYAQLGQRQLHFRDVATDTLGPRWGRYFVGPLQLGLCFGAVVAGTSKNAPIKDYSVNGSREHHVFDAFNGISIIITIYATAVLPEIQATIAPPVKGKMFKGLCMCYAIIVATYFSVAVSGYWAFGNQAKGTVLANFIVDKNKALLPIWFLLMTNVFTLLQVSAVNLVYLQPTNVVFEQKFADPKMGQFSIRNVVPRLVSRSLAVVLATLVAAMLPFFGDMMALFGAFGFIPLNLILPMIFYNVAFKPSKRSPIFWANTLIRHSFLVGGSCGGGCVGSWLHCGYHLTTSIVAPALLSLPFALGLLGWVAGVIFLTLGAMVTFYSYNLLSIVLEHYAQLGLRQLRFRDMARDSLGPRWGRYFVGPLQFGICFGAVIGGTLLAGQSLKFIYLLSSPNGTMQLYHFVFISGALMLVLAQMPSFHSLRHINLVSLVLCLAYSACTVSASIHVGTSKNAPVKDYSVIGSRENRVFGAFNGISIIATTYACGIIPEIQATIAPPVKGKMFKGLCVCYAIVVTTYFSVAVSGYWAFGNQAMGTILANFMVDENKALLPTWFLLMTNVFALLQVSAVTLVYLQPTNEVFEQKFADAKMGQFAVRNVVPRLVSRSISVVIATVLAAMLPFFGDIMALFGAFGFIPLDFILPMIFYNVTFKPSKRSLIFWVNTLIAVFSSVLAVVGAVASVRQIVLDAKTYRLFANI
ncbi:hypothetical protein L1049_010799 [Liquidambar formosana]|uniref:Amino acid transporter transmembrane domain-containing protein n=1 Tax=Liquidambar formosana TaxID=63359 RepID=A0AAP0RQ23_LIQFO